MPLEIRELVIRTTVTSESSELGRYSGGGEGGLSEEEQAAIIAACIDQVLTILQTRSER